MREPVFMYIWIHIHIWGGQINTSKSTQHVHVCDYVKRVRRHAWGCVCVWVSVSQCERVIACFDLCIGFLKSRKEWWYWWRMYTCFMCKCKIHSIDTFDLCIGFLKSRREGWYWWRIYTCFMCKCKICSIVTTLQFIQAHTRRSIYMNICTHI